MSISATEILERKKAEKDKKKDQTEQQEGKIIKLVRDMKSWVCTSCNKEFVIAPHQCTCGSIPRWIEKRIPQSDDLKRDIFKVSKNFIFENVTCLAGQVVSLVEDDEVTKDLLRRDLIIPRKKSTEVDDK